MSEEMNLYKRCKNIFKSHGVDMGGSGGGMVVTINFDGSLYSGEADKTLNEIVMELSSGSNVMLKILINGALYMFIPLGVCVDIEGEGAFVLSAQFEGERFTCESGTTWNRRG